MTVYWDTSALIHYITSRRVREIEGITRTHTLAELFSALTGRGWTELMPDGTTRQKRMGLAIAGKAVADISTRLAFVELSPAEVLAAIQDAPNRGAQGGRIHDLLHAVAAEKAGADELWTLDQHDFGGLGPVPVKQV